MSLPAEKQQRVVSIICDAIEKKLKDYAPESDHKPFHWRLLGRDRMAWFSFVQSVNTMLGTSIYEFVAEELASDVFAEAKRHYRMPSRIGLRALETVNELHQKLVNGDIEPDRNAIDIILREAVAGDTEFQPHKSTVVDLYLRDKRGVVYLIDLKTVKPNKGENRDFKKTLLAWAAIHYGAAPEIEVHSLIAIPYNPYHPQPYERWTLKGMLDVEREVKIAEDFWNFVAGGNHYQSLLDCFAQAGKSLRRKIDKKFASLQFPEP